MNRVEISVEQIFAAFPSGSALIEDAIAGAVGLSETKNAKLYPWPVMDIYGLKIDSLIRDSLDNSKGLLADITLPSFNVYYEIGYALASKKPVVLSVNTSFQNARGNVSLTGLFDNIGFIEYTNADQLSNKLDIWSQKCWIHSYDKDKDHAQPLFILDTLKKTDFRQYIFEEVGNQKVNYRTFDPEEVPRLTADHAIAQVSASSGCIIPLLARDIVDFEKHNLRAAFLAGLCHGYGIEPLIIQYDSQPAPLDYRDFVTNTNSRIETQRHVQDYCKSVLIKNQEYTFSHKRFDLGLLHQIDLGSSAAENESLSLSQYFIETAEYSRAARSAHAIIVGRKGSGKTAIFYRTRSEYGRNKENIVVELRPATHNLSEMRYQILEISNQGIFDHTISAFWHYILYVELLLKMREMLIPKTKRDYELHNKLIELEKDLHLDNIIVSGDFTSRLNSAIEDVLKVLRNSNSSGVGSLKSITNIVYEESIPKLKDYVDYFAQYFDDIVLLVDDLDKGWPPQQLESADIMMIRHLIEVMRRIERDLRKREIKFKSLLFVRSDVYENLVDNTSDRGKYNAINVDWSSKEQLSYLLKQRVTYNFSDDLKDAAWEAINVKMPDGVDSMDKLIQASLYRPRFLIEACEKVLACAINRGAKFVEPADVDSGLKQMSQYLVADFGYELRDVSGVPYDIFYYFIGTTKLLNFNQIREIIGEIDNKLDPKVIMDLLLWYGFLGVQNSSDQPTYIFDCGYDFRRLLSTLPNDPQSSVFVVNDAFLLGLEPS